MTDFITLDLYWLSRGVSITLIINKMLDLYPDISIYIKTLHHPAKKRVQPAISLFSSLFLSHFLTPLQSETDKLTAATSWWPCPDCRRECRNKDTHTHTHKGRERERERKLTHSAAHIKTNYLNSPTLSLSLSSLQFFSASVHMCGRERSAQELKMSELAKPYLKIASFCK